VPKTSKPLSGTGKSSSLAALEQQLGSSSSLALEQLDATLIWMATVALLRKGAAIQLGMNRAGSSLVVTLFDGDYPFKQYCESVEQVHTVMAAVCQTYAKELAKGEWFEYLEQYRPK